MKAFEVAVAKDAVRAVALPTPGGHPNSPTCGHPKLPHLIVHSCG